MGASMTYQVSRNGQMYGPYTLEDLQRYVASGNILLTDMAKSEDMPDWLPVAQILGTAGPTGTEGPAGAGQQHRVNVRVGVDGGCCCAQIHDQRQIQRVEFVRPIERDVGDVIAVLNQ